MRLGEAVVSSKLFPGEPHAAGGGDACGRFAAARPMIVSAVTIPA